MKGKRSQKAYNYFVSIFDIFWRQWDRCSAIPKTILFIRRKANNEIMLAIILQKNVVRFTVKHLICRSTCNLYTAIYCSTCNLYTANRIPACRQQPVVKRGTIQHWNENYHRSKTSAVREVVSASSEIVWNVRNLLAFMW